ncbi:3-methyl-2-oxobutanoate hydroxymethyltransferase [Saccharomonospora saliphila]|uniref:3-methyl-2-oxobutanoate hydroxymethyltransferase n=1 Tax=Saccharomonospora saliphila TaxID=369829 RepID=UPI000371E920|nr:3-methyl-2-oxobutanoate hydroxymethyltransferase [Saccharomonospora saliphila]
MSRDNARSAHDETGAATPPTGGPDAVTTPRANTTPAPDTAPATTADTGGDTPAPYGQGSPDEQAPPRRKVRVHHLAERKRRGETWPMLTAYDTYTAALFDEAGIPVLLVGDSAANTVYGYESSLPVTVEEMLPLVRSVTRSVTSALVVADLPFGSYQVSPEQAVSTSVRFMKEGRAHAVKLEGGRRFAPHVEAVTASGVPVMGHLGFTPQSEHNLGGYRVQGRGAGADELVADALALQDAGAFAVVLEMVPAEVAKQVTHALRVPTVGIGAGPDCDAQVLVWQDMAGLRRGKVPRFVKRYADLAGVLSQAARDFADDVREGRFPAPEHTFH